MTLKQKVFTFFFSSYSLSNHFLQKKNQNPAFLLSLPLFLLSLAQNSHSALLRGRETTLAAARFLEAAAAAEEEMCEVTTATAVAVVAAAAAPPVRVIAVREFLSFRVLPPELLCFDQRARERGRERERKIDGEKTHS